MSKTVERLVVTGAAGLFVVGTGLGINLAFSQPEPPSTEQTCQTRTIATGDSLTSNLVMVHVYNTSNRAGLANRVRINLERRGFLGGVASNNPGKVKARNVTILTTDATDPVVRLLAAQFKGKVAYAAADFPLEENGIALLVGPDYRGLKKARTKLTTDRDVTVCVPTIALS